jgi:hypothetical protein
VHDGAGQLCWTIKRPAYDRYDSYNHYYNHNHYNFPSQALRRTLEPGNLLHSLLADHIDFITFQAII